MGAVLAVGVGVQSRLRLAPPGAFVYFFPRPRLDLPPSHGEVACPRFGTISTERCYRTQSADGCLCPNAVPAPPTPAEGGPPPAGVAPPRAPVYCVHCGTGPLPRSKTGQCRPCAVRRNGAGLATLRPEEPIP